MTSKTDDKIWDEGTCCPDYDFWRRAAYWTPEEGVALMLEKEPRKFNSETLKAAPEKNRLVGLFHTWLELSKRAVEAEILSAKPNPEEFLEWIYPVWYENETEDRLSIFLDTNFQKLSFIDYKTSYENLEIVHRAELKRTEKLQDEVWDLDERLEAESEKSSDNLGAKPKTRKFDNRERNSLLKILLSVAISKYRYKPDDKKSPTSKNIETTTLECGLDVTDETIRSFLREATNGFPEVREIFED